MAPGSEHLNARTLRCPRVIATPTAAEGRRSEDSEEGRGWARAASSQRSEARAGVILPGCGLPDSLICESVSNTIDKGWLSIVREARLKTSL